MIKYKEKESRHPELRARIFENRGVEEKKILKPSKNSVTCPFIYTNMKQGAELIINSVKDNKKILILVDSDVDGYCSAAMVYNYIAFIMKHSNLLYILHNDKAHGLTDEMMIKIKNIKPDLLIIPDASSNDFPQHKILKTEGIEVLVIDHHPSEKFSDDAIVINNQLDKEGNKNLSGAGMVLKLIEAMDKLNQRDMALVFYDLAAVALVADAMDISEEETRWYVLKGLQHMSNPLLCSLLDKESERHISSISYKIAPYMNALIRVGDYATKHSMFDALTYDNRKEEINLRGQGNVLLSIEDYVVKMCERSKSKQTRLIKNVTEDENTVVIDNLPFTILMHNKEECKALSGLIAMKIAEKNHKPTLVFYHDGENLVGSGRSIKEFENFRDYLRECKLFELVEGHKAAFGVKLNFDVLSYVSDYYINKKLDLNDVYMIEKSYEDGASASDILLIEELELHWGKGFEEPIFHVELKNISTQNITIMGKYKNTIKIKHDYVEYVKFFCTKEEIEKIELLKNKVDICLIGKFKVNSWNGYRTGQVIIEDYSITEKQIPSLESWNGFNGFGN